MCILLKSLYIEYSIYKSLKKHEFNVDFYQNKFLLKCGSISLISWSAFIYFLTSIETCVPHCSFVSDITPRGRFHKNWAHSTNHRDSFIKVGPTAQIALYASKKLLKSWA